MGGKIRILDGLRWTAYGRRPTVDDGVAPGIGSLTVAKEDIPRATPPSTVGRPP
ncbi:MAG: hypothetical protein JNN28_06375 [Saprospiraceae bacterium]|nr:hypothetical protein [Saprospiraceae bacterium]